MAVDKDLARAVQASMIVTLVLFLKFLYSNIGGSYAKAKAGLRAPEDRQNQAATQNDKDAADRVQRIVNNDMENVFLGLLIIWGAVLCLAASDPNHLTQSSTAHIVLTSLFAFARISHTLVYMLSLSALRSLCWAVGVLSMFGIAINGVVAAFRPVPYGL